jgi:MFS family permease
LNSETNSTQPAAPDSSPSSATGAAPAQGSSLYQAWALGLLTVAFGLNLLDRQIINILAEPIKRDLGLNDAQLGALTGLSFALLYSVAALPIARLADRGNRVRTVGIAVLCWSVFTAACGAAGSFIQLLLLRVGVGVGEAGCAPPSQSLIADQTPPNKRSAALSIFAIGAPIGASVGLILGGVLAGEIGWRWTMVAAGAPGLVIGALVLLTLRDPRNSQPAAIDTTPPLSAVLSQLLSSKAFPLVALGCATLSFVNYASMAFAASFYLRVHGDGLASLGAELGLPPIAVIGFGLGLLGGAGGTLGAIIGGRLGDGLSANDIRWLVRIPAIGSLLCATGYLFMFTVGDVRASLGLFFVAAFFSNLWSGPGTLAMQRLTFARSRATALAVSLFINSLIGLGLGPLVVGAMSDALAPQLGSGEGLRVAILIGLIAGVLSSALYLAAGRTLSREVAALEERA